MTGDGSAVRGPDTVLAPARDVLTRRSDRAVLVCTDRRAEPLVLRDTALAVWDSFASGARVSEVVDELRVRFDGDPGQIAPAVESLVAELTEAGALEPAP